MAINSYFIWGFLILLLICFSYLFLFVYRYLYAVVIQEVAIISLKSNLIVTKVNRTKFDSVIKNFEDKKTPLINISFDKLKNPFESASQEEETEE